MYIRKKDRELIREKFNGRCAYSGTILEDDWQVDHIAPVRRNWFDKGALHEENHNINNMIPCQKIINHYKGTLTLNEFRNWFMKDLHKRLKKLPKNPRTERSVKRKNYLLKVASYFGITEDKPFSGNFYFENYN